MKKPKVFIILVNWNGINDTIECLESIKSINYKNYEVVLVDNGSEGNQAGTLKQKYPYVHLLQNKTNTGFVYACNQGMGKAIRAGADYVLLLNNDTVVKPDFLKILVDESEKDSKLGIASPKILYYKSNKIWSMGGRLSYLTGISIMIGKGKDSRLFNNAIEPDFLTGCAMLIKRKVIEDIGLLDPIYFAYYEDVDYSFRTRRAHYKIMTIPQSIIHHKKSASVGVRGSNKITSTQAYYWGRNAIIFSHNNFPLFREVYFILIRTFIYPFFVVIKAASFKSILNYFKGMLAGFKILILHQ